MLVAAACSIAVALVTAVSAWTGAAVKAGVDLGDMLQASLNMLPVVALFLGVGALAIALFPRHTGAVAFGAVGGAYVVEQTGALVEAPDWTLAISPFHWIALVPAESFDLVASVTMVAVGLAAAAIAIECFSRRDLVSA